MQMNYILADIDSNRFFPFTFTRPVCDIRIGILTIRQKWEKYIGDELYCITGEHLKQKFPLNYNSTFNSIVINGAICPDHILLTKIQELKPNQVLYVKDVFIAANLGEIAPNTFDIVGLEKYEKVLLQHDALLHIDSVTDIFSKNDIALRADFAYLTANKESQIISGSNQVNNFANIYIEEGAIVECSLLNASTGPIYIGKNAEVMEGSIIRGPFALCEGSVLKMGAKIYGATTIGPYSKVGGEVNNSVIFGYSNKAHDGFLGNSVLGEWCNLGADTNNSNLKNNYSQVQIWDYANKVYANTGMQFCGIVMGDHSKTGINTMLNTGTWVGVCANIFGGSFPPKYVPSFSWGGADGFDTFELSKAIEVAQRVYERRSLIFDEKEQALFTYLFNNFR
jgi:UDP-N-acetylglucosamine diphosphorylase/glucosamine-1-phosphate N-acetyltransferase